MTGDEYMQLLLDRQAAWITEHHGRPDMPPLLEWFVRPGDEDLFTPPPRTTQPKKPTKPRTHRSAASLIAEREHMAQQADTLTAPLINDRAAAGGEGIGIRQAARIQQREDARLRTYAALRRRINSLDSRIIRAQAREKEAE